MDGSIVSVCKDCGATDRVVLPATGHKLVSSGHDATCTQDGYQRYMCTQCDYWYEKKTPALGHDWSDWDVLLEAGSKRDGIKQRTCMRCGEVETYAIPSDHHEHTMKKHVVQPTCTEQGYTEYRCINKAGLPCGERYIVEGSRTPALGHDYSGDSGIRTIVEPTCTTSGLKEYNCSRCGDTYTEIIDPLRHNYELKPEKSREADCTQPARSIMSAAGAGMCIWCASRQRPRLGRLDCGQAGHGPDRRRAAPHLQGLRRAAGCRDPEAGSCAQPHSHGHRSDL